MMTMMLLMVLAPLWLVGLIVLAVAAAAGLVTHGQRLPGKPARGAVEILARRYALGEISKEQHDQMLADIAN